MTRSELVAYLRAQPWAVQASADENGAPQAAVIGVAVADDLQLVFDTRASARKHANLLRNPRIALVIGWDEGRTVQYEGLARPAAESDAHKELYLEYFPDGKERAQWPDIAYWSVTPTWIRYLDVTTVPPTLLEWHGAAVAALQKSP